jgi:signal transduction histidine kinase
LAAPLAGFAAAAERLALDGTAAPLPETGPRELRAATAAVNRMRERLSRFVEDRTRMLAAISHDLRTPLTRLRLRAEFIEDAEIQRKMLADIEEMSAMIAATLAFAREDADQEPRQTLELAALLRSLCQQQAEIGASVTFQLAPSSQEERLISAKPTALRRAFGNLIENGIAYGERVRVVFEAPMEMSVPVVIQIDDDGPGIPIAEQEKVFAPFYRLEHSRNRATGGVGLGLAVARSLIRGHGGEILLRNRPEGGLRVIVTLP